MSSGSTSVGLPLRTARRGQRAVPRLLSAVRAPPELPAVLAIAAVLNLWGLSINGWANTYYSAAVRSMTTSWHDFLFASLDKTGLMTVDKPPLALWVQALSARIFGVNSLSILVPQALMGVAAAGLTYDLVRRRFGRAGRLRRRARARADADGGRHLPPQQPRRAADAVLCGRAVVRRPRARGRAHEVARVGGRVRRPRLRDQDGGGAVRRARASRSPTCGSRPAGGWRPCASCRWAAWRWRSSGSPGRCW